MDATYPGRGIVSGKNRKLFEAWDSKYPVTEAECSKAFLVVANGGFENSVTKKKCSRLGMWGRGKR